MASSRTLLAVFVILATSGDPLVLPGCATASTFPLSGMPHFSLPLFHLFPSRRQPSPPPAEVDPVSLRDPVVPFSHPDSSEAYNPLNDLYVTQLVQDLGHELKNSRRHRLRVRRKRLSDEGPAENPNSLEEEGEEVEEEDAPLGELEHLHPEERIQVVKKALGLWMTLSLLNPEQKSQMALVKSSPEEGVGSSLGVGVGDRSWASASSGRKRRLRPFGMPMRWGR